MKKTNELSSCQMKNVKGGKFGGGMAEFHVDMPDGGGGSYDRNHVCRDDLGGLQERTLCETDADCEKYWGPGSKCVEYNS